MVALEEVLARLDLPEDTQDLLERTDFNDAKWVQFCQAPAPEIASYHILSCG